MLISEHCLQIRIEAYFKVRVNFQTRRCHKKDDNIRTACTREPEAGPRRACGGPVAGLWWACGGPVVGLW